MRIIPVDLDEKLSVFLIKNIVRVKSNLVSLAHRWDSFGARVEGGVRELFVPEKIDRFRRKGLRRNYCVGEENTGFEDGKEIGTT